MLTRSILSVFIFISLAVPILAQSQNLVPNGSFEEAIYCPEFLGELQAGCAEWYGGIQFTGADSIYNPSPDWFHTCAINADLSPPSTIWGYQIPYEGNGYAGIITYHSTSATDYREILSVPLLESLQVGNSYLVRFQTVLSDLTPPVSYGTNNLGVKFTSYPSWTSHNEAVSNWSHFDVENVISDTLNWTEISFVFIADSAYGYMHIGNFYDDDNTTTVYLSDALNGSYGLYFIDDVEVTQMTTSLNNQSINPNTIIYPNPASDFFEVTGEPDLTIISISLFDSFGRKVADYTNQDRFNHRFSISNLSSGIYVVKILNENMDSRTFKLFKSN